MEGPRKESSVTILASGQPRIGCASARLSVCDRCVWSARVCERGSPRSVHYTWTRQLSRLPRIKIKFSRSRVITENLEKDRNKIVNFFLRSLVQTLNFGVAVTEISVCVAIEAGWIKINCARKT